jgi:LysM repeat protein
MRSARPQFLTLVGACILTLSLIISSCTSQKKSSNSGLTINVTRTSSTSVTTVIPVNQVRYTVTNGDTLIAIANQFEIHLNHLVRANNIADPTLIYVGQVLIIPPPPDKSLEPMLTVAPPTNPSLPPIETTTTLRNN